MSDKTPHAKTAVSCLRDLKDDGPGFFRIYVRRRSAQPRGDLLRFRGVARRELGKFPPATVMGS